MISKAVLKEYSSLLQKKYRDQHRKFLCEGVKSVIMGIESSRRCYDVICSGSFAEENPEVTARLTDYGARVSVVSRDIINRLSDAKTPQEIVGVFAYDEPDFSKTHSSFPPVVIYCDNVSDPGNLGTMIRIADWFGFEVILVSAGSVDIHNPKTVRSSMGSVFNTEIYAGAGAPELTALKKGGYRILSADIQGTEIGKIKNLQKTVLCFSSESHGPSGTVAGLADGFITIPGKGQAESLNVASAASIIMYHYSTLKS